MATTRGCLCPEHSPFRWNDQRRDSIFVAVPGFRPVGSRGESKSQRATAVVERDRMVGKNTGTVHGLSSKTRHAPPPPVKDFHVYTKASRAKRELHATRARAAIHKD
jgi:hypothetical protein